MPRSLLPALVLGIVVAACAQPPAPTPTPGASSAPTPTPVGMTPEPSGDPSAAATGEAGSGLELADVQGIDWVATSVAGLTPDHAVAPTIRFDGDRIGGSAGCNRYGGTAVIEGGRLTLGEEFSLTAMLCHGPVAELESAFLRALHSAQTIEIVEGELIISGPEGELRLSRGVGA